ASISALTWGTVARQRGRAAQFVRIMSRIRSAVVLPSSDTGLSSGTGGGFARAPSPLIFGGRARGGRREQERQRHRPRRQAVRHGTNPPGNYWVFRRSNRQR